MGLVINFLEEVSMSAIRSKSGSELGAQFPVPSYEFQEARCRLFYC